MLFVAVDRYVEKMPIEELYLTVIGIEYHVVLTLFEPRKGLSSSAAFGCRAVVDFLTCQSKLMTGGTSDMKFILTGRDAVRVHMEMKTYLFGVQRSLALTRHRGKVISELYAWLSNVSV